MKERTHRGRDFTGPSEKKEYDGSNNEENKVVMLNMPAPDSRVIFCQTRAGTRIETGFTVVAIGSRKQNAHGLILRIIICSVYREKNGVCEMRKVDEWTISLVFEFRWWITRQPLE